MRRSAGAGRRFPTIAMPTIGSASFKIICGFTIGTDRSAASAQVQLRELPSATAVLSIVLPARDDLTVSRQGFACNDNKILRFRRNKSHLIFHSERSGRSWLDSLLLTAWLKNRHYGLTSLMNSPKTRWLSSVRRSIR